MRQRWNEGPSVRAKCESLRGPDSYDVMFFNDNPVDPLQRGIRHQDLC